MSDDKSKRGYQDRNRISLDEEYEIRYFAEQHGLTTEQAIEIIKKAGGDRSAAENAARQLSGGNIGRV